MPLMHTRLIPIGILEDHRYNVTMAEKIKRCMVCGKPSELSICEICKAEIQGEALDKKTKINKKVPVSEIPLKKKQDKS